MRLAIPEVGKNCHAREDRCVRKIGRLVSDLRDAQVRLQTLIQLRDEAAKKSEQQSFSSHRGIIVTGTGKFFRRICRLAKASHSATGTRESASVEMAAGGFDLEADLRRGMKDLQARPTRTRQNKSRSGTRKFSCLAQASERPLVSAAHFAAAKSRGPGRDGSRRGSLGELLGSEHDLDFLRARLEKESGDEALADELSQLQKLIRKRCKRLRRDALELGRRFYAEPSKGVRKTHLHLRRQTDVETVSC